MTGMKSVSVQYAPTLTTWRFAEEQNILMKIIAWVGGT